MQMGTLREFTVITVSVAAVGVGALFLASQAVAADRLFFEGDMVRGPTKQGLTGPSCVLTSQYKRGEKVVWRIRVLDPKTGDQLDDKGLKSLIVEMSDGQKFPLHFGTHPRKTPTDTFWTSSWEVPMDYPTGTFAYKAIAVDLDGKAHTWEPFNVDLSQFSVIPGEVTYTK
jgi:hypothetical protein